MWIILIFMASVLMRKQKIESDRQKYNYDHHIPKADFGKPQHFGKCQPGKPQREEYFADSGFYKYHEAYHLLKFANEKQILEKAYAEYQERKRNNQWKN